MEFTDGMSSAVNREEIKAFFEGWEVYQKVIANNYMIHAEIVDHLVTLIDNHATRNMRILEFGCGDAYVVRQAAKRVPVARYVGIDLSEMALQHARDGLKPLISDYELIHNSMESTVAALTGSFDIILAGYSLHHLMGDRKNHFFASLAPRLAADGILVVYDLVTRPREPRDAYLARICSHFDANWRQLSHAQLRDIRAHVTDKDYPESLMTWEALGRDVGLVNFAQKFTDPAGIFSMMEYRR